MTALQGLALGALQGVAEFLPISSSGHLKIARSLFGMQDAPLLFDVFLHLATLAAVVVFFRAQIWALLKAFGRIVSRKKISDDFKGEGVLAKSDLAARKTVAAIIIATCVTGAIGIAVEKTLSNIPVKAVCAMLVATAALLALSSFFEGRSPRGEEESEGVSWRQALVIGAAQGLGTLPGISRSGATISAALFCGTGRAAAGEFSFIVSIPAVLGAFILELKDAGAAQAQVGIAPLALGFAAALVAGYASLALLMKIVRRGRLGVFAFYLIPAGILGMIFLK